MSMKKIREVLRLTHELGLSVRQVREATGVGKTAVSEYVSRAKVVGITWPIPPEVNDAALERLLFAPAGFHEGSTKRLPDWTKVHEELKRRGVTLMILWEEHRAEHVDGHGYSRFCELYGEWRRRLSPTMRQTYVAGDKFFVDWAGDTVPRRTSSSRRSARRATPTPRPAGASRCATGSVRTSTRLHECALRRSERRYAAVGPSKRLSAVIG